MTHDKEDFDPWLPFNSTPPAPTVRDIGGLYVIDWPDPKPRWFPISAEAFEALVESVNDARLALEPPDD